MKPVRARLGPHSTKTRAPSAYMRSIWAVHSTGEATCRESTSRTSSGSSGYQPESTLVVIGRRGWRIPRRVRMRRRGSLAGATMRVWKAWETGSG